MKDPDDGSDYWNELYNHVVSAINTEIEELTMDLLTLLIKKD